ncbi:MAG: hypothetical protein M5U26_13420 [Planctomycetota bacterium]|nr:hypothetical protein [Planctomycetota bacterium]
MRRLNLMLLLAGIASLGLARAEDFQEPDPAAYREQVMKNGHLHQDKGEAFCWHAAYGAGTFLAGYKAFKNPKWLEEAETYYDWFVSKLEKDPDGYEGWLGPTINNTPGLKADALVGDAVLCEPLMNFVLTVKADPELEKRWGEKAQKYLDLCTRIVWEKWNKRGCYYEDAAGWGSYHTHDKYIDEKTGQWVSRPNMVVSDNLNKHYSAGHVILRLWRATGKPEYKERVKKIYGRAKTMWRYYPDEDRIVWNFWMPHGPYDIEGTAPKSWVAVHPERAGYQAGEVSDWVEVYDSGLVFEQADLERIIRTNHWMYNEGQGWRNADGTTKAGTLWTALERFDEKIRKLHEDGLRGKKDAASVVHLAYLKNVTEKQLGWKRLYVEDESRVEVVKVPLMPGRNITLAQAIPNLLETANGDRTKFVTQTRAKGTLKIELLDESGKEVLGTLHEIEVGDAGSAYHAPRWDGTNPKTGQKDAGAYQVRWTLAGESRAMPVWVKLGEKRARTGPELLEPGQTLAVDFESEPDARWHIEGGAPVEEQAHGGKKGLKLTEGQSAVCTFADEEDLPVKVSMWVWDAGKKLGKKTANGPAWGIKDGNGNKFCIRPTWRKYLDGDNQYAWFNTGENQWFSPHPAKLARKDGWSLWVFDFSDPAGGKVTRDGEAVGTLDPKFTPKGAAALYFLGGDKEAGGVIVDDIQVEYAKK